MLQYEVVTLPAKRVVGLKARTGNTDPACPQAISGLWEQFMRTEVWQAALQRGPDAVCYGLYTNYGLDDEGEQCGEEGVVLYGKLYSIDTLEGAGFEDMLLDICDGETLDRPSGNYTVYRRPPERQEDIGSMPTLTPQDEPLTIEQLRQMDGEPVWDENGECYLVDTTFHFCSCSDPEIAVVDKYGDAKRYPGRRTLYRRPPEEECE